MSTPYNISSGLAYDGHTAPSEFVVHFQDWLSGANLNKQDNNHIRRLALLKQSLKPRSRAHRWFEAKQQSGTPFATLTQALEGINEKFYTSGMQAREMQEIDDPSFIQEDSETVQDFSSRFTVAMIASERGRAALRMGPRSEAEYGLSFRRKLLPYLQADLQRFNIAFDKTVEELTAQLEHYERADHTINQYRRMGQLRAEAHGIKRAAEREEDNPRPNKTHVLAPITEASLLAEQVARQKVQIERMTRAEEERKQQRNEQLRLEAEEARHRGATRDMIAQVSQVVRQEVQSHMQNTGEVPQTRPQTQDHGRGPKCYSCGENGHMSRDCQNGVRCYTCGRAGHTSRNCTQNRYQRQPGRTSVNDRNNRRQCYNCGRDGHDSRDCRSRPSNTQNRGNCHRCGQRGYHVTRDCPAWGTTCGRCGGQNHTARCCTTRQASGQNVNRDNQRDARGGRSRNEQSTDNALMQRMGRAMEGIQAQNQRIMQSLHMVDNTPSGSTAGRPGNDF